MLKNLLQVLIQIISKVITPFVCHLCVKVWKTTTGLKSHHRGHNQRESVNPDNAGESRDANRLWRCSNHYIYIYIYIHIYIYIYYFIFDRHRLLLWQLLCFLVIIFPITVGIKKTNVFVIVIFSLWEKRNWYAPGKYLSIIIVLWRDLTHIKNKYFYQKITANILKKQKNKNNNNNVSNKTTQQNAIITTAIPDFLYWFQVIDWNQIKCHSFCYWLLLKKKAVFLTLKMLVGFD